MLIRIVIPALVTLVAQTFDVASVKPNKIGNAGGEGSTRENVSASPGSLTMQNVTLQSCLKWAYGVKGFQISGPAWLGSERYDIAAKASGAVPEEQLREMLRTLLAERFHMTVRRETKELPIYALVAAKKGLKLRPASGDGSARIGPEAGDLVFRNISMPELAERLATLPFKVDRPVVDETGIEGRFDFSLRLGTSAVELKTALEGMDRGMAIFDFFQQQVGLKLESRKAPIELLVIDHAEKVPVAN